MTTARKFGLLLLVAIFTLSLTFWVHAQEADDAAGAADTAEPAEPAEAAPADAGPVDATGEWTYSFEGFGGPVDVVISLTQEGETLTGTVSGFAGQEDDIQEGAIDGNAVTFKTTREFGDQTATTTYTGTIEGDTFTGVSETVFTRDFEATRQ